MGSDYDSEALGKRLPELKTRKDEFYKVSQVFYTSTKEKAPPEEQAKLLLELYHVANEFFGAVESIIAECGVLAHVHEDANIRDITGTSLNLLEKIPTLIRTFRTQGERLKFKPNSFQPGSAAYQHMQALVARYHPEKALELKPKFAEVGLGVCGFEAGAFRAPRVVFSLHGIRTRAPWQKTFADLAQHLGWECRLDKWSFGFFSVFKFLWPFSRTAKVAWFRHTYEEEMSSKELKLDKNEFPSIVAHSFGTYILGNALLKYEYIRFNKVILCGSILPVDFPWDKLIERGQVQGVRNEHGVRDFWVMHVGKFVPNTGPSGRDGFACKHARLEQQEFHYTHSEYFEKGHMREFWITFLGTKPPLVEAKRIDVAFPQRTHPWLLYALIGAPLAVGLVVALFGLLF